MAILLDTNSIELTNFTEYQNTFMRQGAYPLDAYSIFTNLTDAEDYAKKHAAAYVGQTLVVANKEGVKQYIIDEAGTLQLAGGGATRELKINSGDSCSIPIKPGVSKIKINFDLALGDKEAGKIDKIIVASDDYD